MGRTLVNQRPPADEFLSADELSGAFEALSPDDKLKLAAIEAIRRRGTEFAAGELIHEAVCKMLTGERNCPRSVPFMAFMAQTMRSLASHSREKRHRSKSIDDVPQPAVSTSDGVGAVSAPSPEDDLMNKQDATAVQAIHRFFDDDEEAQLVLLGWQDELRGAELREATGLSQSQIDYAKRRIRVRMNQAYPKGWNG